eukprot:1160825-Pelagomonas_calceolata.AAC.8
MTGEWMNGQYNAQMAEWMDRWMDGRHNADLANNLITGRNSRMMTGKAAPHAGKAAHCSSILLACEERSY